MKIKLVHAHFLLSTGDYNNERVGFTSELEEGDTVESAVAEMRQLAIVAIGPKSRELYDQNQRLRVESRQLEERMNRLRSEWEATAEFLKAQGLKPEAPSMPQFQRLLNAVKVESQEVTAEFVEEAEPDNIPFDPATQTEISDGF
ncbi:hypothetical protein [Nostoc sp.]|uniref:hypothetical protein n=1 Tax=Nostoc sp. TaxID=1180 RepID=UPI002FF50B83